MQKPAGILPFSLPLPTPQLGFILFLFNAARTRIAP